MPKRSLIAALTWALLASAIVVPVLIAVLSPLQIGRDAVYIAGSLGGIVCLVLLFVQPLLVAGYLPSLPLLQQRRWHRFIGGAVLIALLLHLGGLYLTSPDDMSDALLLVAPTPFSIYGVIALWALVLTALLAFTRSRLKLSQQAWRIAHSGLAAVVVVASVVHTLMIEGVMGASSKIVLCACVLLATALVLWKLRLLKPATKAG